MKSFRIAGGVLATWLALAVPIGARTFPAAAQRSFGELKAVVAQSETNDSQQIHLQWFATAGAERVALPSQQVRVLDRRRGLGPLSRERNPQLSTDHLVVISSDEAGRELDWRIVPDPRLIRAEVPDQQGTLSGRLLQRTEANLLVDIPDRPEIVRLRVYTAEWSGGAFVLRLLLTADLQ